MVVRALKRYTHWLHTQWPAGTVEPLPEVGQDGITNVPGVYVVGDLTGVPLLKFSADTGAAAIERIAERSGPREAGETESEAPFDVVIVGGGVAGLSAAKEAQGRGLGYRIYEATEPLSTIVNFPKGKPIFTYPTDMTPRGAVQFHERSEVKEGLLEDLKEQTLRAGIEPVAGRVHRIRRGGGELTVELEDGSEARARNVVVAIGRSGNFRKLAVPGEEKDKVYNRLHDPKDFCDQRVLVVGGGDSALETAIALATCGSHVTLSYRRNEFARPKPENVAKVEALAADPSADVEVEEPESERTTTAAGDYLGAERPHGSLELMMGSEVTEIGDAEVRLRDAAGAERRLPNDTVFAMLGREAPLDFFRRSGIAIRGEWRPPAVAGLVAFLAFCVWMYHWKAHAGLFGIDALRLPELLALAPGQLWGWVESLGGGIGAYFQREGTLGHTLALSASGRSFYYTLAYCLCVIVFGVKRIRRRRTPYITWQTATLMAIQTIPLFLLPELILPWLGHNGVFAAGVGDAVADTFFPEVDYGHGREYWRAYGLILAWPLMAWNWFTADPLWGWLILGSIQTFVIIPWMIRYWGKGAYCGWICSCGALAETMGDAHRHKMPHGPIWNRVNMVGQALLAFAVVIMLLRIAGWIFPESVFAAGFTLLASELPVLSWAWFVDLLWAGILGVGLYFHFSGRVWCRFACPLAALMHVYARFSRFRILADKKRCISCNVCTSVCHQGIDVMSFANKGIPMEDPQCVRCSACVQSCPTGVLRFGQVDPKTGAVLKEDPGFLAASPVRMAELTVEGKPAGKR